MLPHLRFWQPAAQLFCLRRFQSSNESNANQHRKSMRGRSWARISHRRVYPTGACILQAGASRRSISFRGVPILWGGVFQRRVSHRLAPYRRTSYRHVSHKYISLVSLSYGRTSHERAPPVGFSRGVHLLSSQSLCPLHLPQSLRPLPLPLP
jgi:hypothetical protein